MLVNVYELKRKLLVYFTNLWNMNNMNIICEKVNLFR